MIVHLASTNDIGLRAAVEAPARHPDGTWNIKLTVAVFRPWRGSQATIASDPTFDAAPRFARPHRRLGEEFSPAVAGCWCREPLTPRLARPKLLSRKPSGQARATKTFRDCHRRLLLSPNNRPLQWQKCPTNNRGDGLFHDCRDLQNLECARLPAQWLLPVLRGKRVPSKQTMS